MVCDVAIELGWSPRDVMRRLTFPQLAMIFSRSREKQIDWTELQANTVWAIFSGKYERPGSKRKVNEADTLAELTQRGLVVDG